MLALITDAVNPVNAIKNSKKIIVIILLNFFCFFPIVFENAVIIYVICEPDTANICVKLLFLKLSSVSSDIFSLSPIKIPIHKPASFSFNIFFIFDFILFCIMYK